MKIAPVALVAELSRLLGESDGTEAVLAFDGDGTLWSGDVGEDLFRLAMKRQILREEAREALLREARKFSIDIGAGDANANALAGTLLASYLAGVYPERDICGMMTWCYAGHALADVEALAKSALDEHDIKSRLTDELGPVLEWGRRNRVRMVVISASPRVVVEPAAAYWGFSPENVTAATARVQGGCIEPELSAPVPYAEAKCAAGRALFGSARWLGSFGDNTFDIEMLKTAELGIAVRPKRKLETELASLGLRTLGPLE